MAEDGKLIPSIGDVLAFREFCKSVRDELLVLEPGRAAYIPERDIPEGTRPALIKLLVKEGWETFRQIDHGAGHWFVIRAPRNKS